MDYNSAILERYIYLGEIEKEMDSSDINEKTMILKLREFKTDRTEEIKDFIEKIKKINKQSNLHDVKGSGIYRFKTGDTIIELDLLVQREMVEIKPRIFYNPKTIQDDFMKITALDMEIYEMLKKMGLQ